MAVTGELFTRVLDICTTVEHEAPLSIGLKRRIAHAWVCSIDKAIQVLNQVAPQIHLGLGSALSRADCESRRSVTI